MMPLFDSLISTFDRSALVAPVGEALYIALIAFWVEAVKHYRVKGLSATTYLRVRSIY